MGGEDKTRQPLTPRQKLYVRIMIIILVATAFVVAGFFAMTPLLGRPVRADDLLAMISGFLVLQGTVMMIVVFTIAPREMDAPPRRLSNVLAAATCAPAMLLPIVGDGWIDPRLNFAIVLVLIAASYWFAWRAWRVSDELDRTITMETYAGSFLVLFTAYWVYAVGERLGLFGGLTAWGAVSFATLATVVVSIWIAVRHGGMVESPEDEPSLQ